MKEFNDYIETNQWLKKLMDELNEEDGMRLEDAFYAFKQHYTNAENLPISAVSGSTFTTDDMKKAFMAGADKKKWTKIYLTGVVSGQDYVLEPIFEKWFEYYR